MFLWNIFAYFTEYINCQNLLIMETNKIEKKPVKVSSFALNDENPFVEKAIEQIEENKISKRRFVKGNRGVEQSIVNREGEVTGHTAFLQYIEVDEDKFTKLYLSQFSAFFDLSQSSIRVFGYIMSELRPKQDMIIFLMDKCKDYTQYKTTKPIYKGLAELLDAGIIARGPADNLWFINPLVMFNGDRVSFAKTYLKKNKNEAVDNREIILESPNIKDLENERQEE